MLVHFYPDAAALLEAAAAEDRAAHPAADPLRQHIAAGEELGRAAAAALLEKASTDGESNLDRRNSDPTWSPDGSTIAFVSTRDGNQEI